MPAISTGPSHGPSLRKMTTRSIIGTMVFFHLCALPFIFIAIMNIWREPRSWSSCVLLGFAAFLLLPSYTDYLWELLRRRRENKAAAGLMGESNLDRKNQCKKNVV